MNKKIILILGVIVAIILIAYFSFVKFSSKATYVAQNIDTETESEKILAKDSDNDGLKDWEEQLWKTDPLKADTDGDGVLDGAEIKSGHDPLIKGPNDKLNIDTITNKVNKETEEDLSDTDKFSRELFVKILGASQAENPPTQEDFQNFLNESIQKQIDSQKNKTFVEGDFRVDGLETSEKIKTWANKIAEILKQKPPQPLEYEIDIVNRAETTNKPSELQKLEGNISAYKKIEENLQKVTVPKSAINLHIKFTNSVESMAWSIRGMTYIYSDPLKSLPGISAYADNAQNFYTTLRAIKSYLLEKQIEFTPEDDGYQLFTAL